MIVRLGKQFLSSVRPIQGVLNQSTRGYARSPRPPGTRYQSNQFRQETGSRPLFFPGLQRPTPLVLLRLHLHNGPQKTAAARPTGLWGGEGSKHSRQGQDQLQEPFGPPPRRELGQ